MDTRHRIIEEAIEVFAEKGKHGARMEEVAARAGVNKAMVYYYYTSKDHLFYSALVEIFARLNRIIEDALQHVHFDQLNAADKLEHILQLHLRALSQHQKYAHVIIKALIDEPLVLTRVMTDITPGQGTFLPQTYDSILKEGIANGSFRAIDHTQVTISIVGMNLIYFMGKPIGETLLDININDEAAFLRERESSVLDTLKNGIFAATKPAARPDA